jgi:hypothetical protein
MAKVPGLSELWPLLHRYDANTDREKREGDFIDGLINEFKFDDRDALIDAVHSALQRYATTPWPGHAWPDVVSTVKALSAVDELNSAGRKVAELLDEPLIHHLVYSAAEYRYDDATTRYYEETREKLPRLLEVVLNQHQKTVGSLPVTGVSGERADLRELARELARFWIDATGKRFKHNHNLAETLWTHRGKNIWEPARKQASSLFVFRVIEHYIPERVAEWPTLGRDIAQEFRPPPSPDSKRRGRPPGSKTRKPT